MEIALKEMERLNRIITDFLTYSRPDTAGFQTFELHRILDETLELLKHVEQDRGNISIGKKYTATLSGCRPTKNAAGILESRAQCNRGDA